MAMGVLASARGRNRRRAPMAEINVTPLVDVMLVLLIIFMVTAPLLNAGVDIDLPDSRANPVDAQPEAITVNIDEGGNVYLGETLVPDADLPNALAELPRGDGGGPDITLRADRTLDYGRVMAVMGELNAAGLNRVSMITNASGAPVNPQPVDTGSVNPGSAVVP